MKKWNLVIDVENCNNCHMCSLACKDEFVGNSFPGYSAEMPKRGADWIKMNKKDTLLKVPNIKLINIIQKKIMVEKD